MEKSKRIKDLKGRKFNKLKVLSFAYVNVGAYWNCICDCGNEIIVSSSNMIQGNVKSCGCLLKKHGLYKTKIYKAWYGMKDRCYNKNNAKYHNYGGRGIKVCDEWNNFINFKNDMYDSYLKHIKKYDKRNTSIERIDNNKGYYKENCKWATIIEQARNKLTTINITYNGETKCIIDWSRELGINKDTIYYRLKNGWSIEESLTVKPKSHQSFDIFRRTLRERHGYII